MNAVKKHGKIQSSNWKLWGASNAERNELQAQNSKVEPRVHYCRSAVGVGQCDGCN